LTGVVQVGRLLPVLGLESDGVLSKTFLLGGKSPEGQRELPASGDKGIPVSERAGEKATSLGRSCRHPFQTLGCPLHPKQQMQTYRPHWVGSCGDSLGPACAGAHPNLLHRPGSLLCHGDVVFQPPAPSSLEVLEALVLTVGPDRALADSDFQVDPYSISVGGE